MASIITATTTSGLTQSADNSGVLQLASGAGNLVTIPAVTGTTMFSGNIPAFRAVLSGNQTIAFNTYTKLTLNSEIFDTNNCYNTSTYRFTPNVAGYYQVSLQILANGISTRSYYVSGMIYKNGSVDPNSEGRVSLTYGDGADNSVYSSGLIYMNGTTDYLEAYMYQYDYTTNSTMLAKVAGTNFNACLVRAA